MELQKQDFYFTFGSAEYFPFNRGDYVKITAFTRSDAVAEFRKHYPDHTEGLVNCASIYNEKEWMEHTSQYYIGKEPAKYFVANKEFTTEQAKVIAYATMANRHLREFQRKIDEMYACLDTMGIDPFDFEELSIDERALASNQYDGNAYDLDSIKEYFVEKNKEKEQDDPILE